MKLWYAIFGLALATFTDRAHSDEFKLKLPLGLQESTAYIPADEHRGAFKTPTLRDVAKLPPYMHDGSLKTLEEVIAFYNKGGAPNQWLSKEVHPLHLTAAEQKDLVAFMEALTGQVATEVSSPPKLPE
jgi:cytochrome c peroxidase